MKMRIIVLLLFVLLTTLPVFTANGGTYYHPAPNVTYSLPLFAESGGAMPLEMVLTYRGSNPLSSPLGSRWSHSYNITLNKNSDGTMVVINGRERHFFFGAGSGYRAQLGDDTTLVLNADTTWTVTLGSGFKYHFNSDKRLTAIDNRQGKTIRLDHSYSQTTVTDSAGRAIVIHYRNGTTIIDWIKVPAPALEQKYYDFTYNTTFGMLETVTAPAPDPAKPTERPRWEYKYLGNDLEYVKDPQGHISKYGYSNGKLSRTVDPEGVVDMNGTETADVEQHSKTWSYGFARGVAEVGATTVTEKDGGEWVYRYDTDKGVLLSKENPEGKRDQYTYYFDVLNTDSRYGMKKTVSVPVDATSRYVTEYVSYDAHGNPTEIKSYPFTTVAGALDSHRLYSYDAYSRITSTTDKITGTTATVDYVMVNGVETVTISAPKINVADASGPRTVLLYRADGQLDLVTDPLNRSIDYAYDANGLLQSATDNSSNIVATFSDLDAMGRPQTVTVSAGTLSRVSHVSYDALGRATSISRDGSIDPQTQQLVSYVTTFGYDLLGNRTRVTDAENHDTTFAYNDRGQATKITDALNQVTELLYSGAGCASCGGGGVDKLTDVINASHFNPATTEVPKASFRYDAVGRVKSETDELGNTRLFAYDDAGRLLDLYQDALSGQGSIADEIDATDTQLLHYVWSVDGKLQSKTDKLSAATTTFSYYPLPTAPTTDPLAGRLKTAVNAAASYTFDYYANGWLKSVNDGTRTVEYQYDAAGHRELVTVKEGTATLQSLDYVYDPTSKRLTDIISSVAGTFHFGADAWGRRSSLGYPKGVTTTYIYHDDMDWLTSLDTPLIGVSITYPQHDKVGNRKARTEGSLSTGYAYDATYQLHTATTGTSIETFFYDAVGNRESGPTVKDSATAAYDHYADNSMTQGRKFTYAYDARGNRQYGYFDAGHSKYWQYSWDAENRLIEAKLVKGTQTLRTVTFKYDPFGRRVEKKVTGLAPQVPVPLTTRYVYDGEDIILQTVSNGTTTTTTHFVPGPGIDDPLAMVRGGQKYFYHADGLGSIVAISDSSKAVVQRYAYDAYGMVTSTNPAFENAYTFTGREWDKEIGLYYYRARYYDPMEGRFISKDPIGFAGGDVNLFRYVGNSMENWRDPDGLSPVGWIVTLTRAGMKRVKPLYSKAEAVMSRMAGENVEAASRQSAKEIERAVADGNSLLRHKGHDLPNGGTGRPHFQTEGKWGHTFWTGVGLVVSLLDPFDSIAGELATDEELMAEGYSRENVGSCP